MNSLRLLRLGWLWLVSLAVGCAAGAQPASAPSHTRDWMLSARYLNFPVKTGAPKQRAALEVAGRVVRTFELELAPANPDFWVFLDVAEWRGQKATLRVTCDSETAAAVQAIELGDAFKDSADLYREQRRPQIHFSSRRGWLNDPNGLVYYSGEYHLFYQLHPYGWNAGSKHWGHAISRDLVHWTEQPIALYADESGQMYSGSAVVDWKNTSGFQQGKEPPLVLIYTATGPPRVQALAYSNDRGRTWTKYVGNPVLPELKPFNRDPKVVWHQPSRKWIMVFYAGYPLPGEKDAKGKPAVRHVIEFYGSPDLKKWTPLSRVEGFYECPDFFELPFEGSPGTTKWVLHGGLGDYMLGSFDGTTFTPETPILRGPRGSAFYAAQSFSDMPDGRRIQIGWARMTQSKARAIFGGMPFNQMMNFPTEVTLRATPDGPRVAWQPVRELATLRRIPHHFAPGALAEGANPLEGFDAETFELQLELEPGTAQRIFLNLLGVELVYDAAARTLAHEDGPSAAPLVNGRLRLHALVDRGIAEVFVDDGTLYLPLPLRPPADGSPTPRPALRVQGGAAKLLRLEVNQLASIWRTVPSASPP